MKGCEDCCGGGEVKGRFCGWLPIAVVTLRVKGLVPCWLSGEDTDDELPKGGTDDPVGIADCRKGLVDGCDG